MNKLLLSILAFLAVAAISACDDEASYMPQIEQMKDSVFKTHPTTGAITIKVEEHTNLKVVLGDEKLYAASPAIKQKEANDLGLIAVRIFGKASYIRTGTLILTKDIRNSAENPADGVAVPINIDSLKQAVGK